MKSHKLKIKLIGTMMFVLSLSGFAHENPGAIVGTVVEQETNSPVAFANVALIDAETKSIVTGIISDENGNFKISGIPLREYQLEVSFLGYTKKVLKIALDEQHNTLNIGRLALENKAEFLDEVTVTEERLKGTQEIDRTVYTINDKVQNVSKDGLDVLKHIPGVSVDFQENVSVEGSGNVLYLVNGIARDKEFVGQLRPENINKVEVITNPGVEYNADVDAVINIVLKKPATGGTGGVELTGGDPNKFTGKQSANLEYGGNKYRIFASDRLHYQSYVGHNKREVENLTENNLLIFKQIGQGDAQWTRNNGTYGIDYFIDNKNTINLYGTYYSVRRKQTDFNERGTQTVDGNLTEQYDLLSNSNTVGRGFFNSLFYKHSSESNESDFTTQINHYNYTSTTDNDYRFTYTYLGGAETTPLEILRTEESANDRNVIEWKNDFSQKVKQLRFKMGFWSYYQWIENENTEQFQTKNFDYNEWRHEGYLNAAGKTGALQYSGGARLAFSRSRINHQAKNQYIEILPQANVMYTIKKGRSIKLNVGRRIIRPDMNQLDPFETRPDSLTIIKGNPDLKPQLINKIELEYAINYKSNYIGPKLYCAMSKNAIQQKTTITNDGVSINMQDNIGEIIECGLLVSSSINITRWAKLNATAGVSNTILNSENDYRKEKLSSLINAAAIFSPWKERKISFTTMVQYHGPRIGYKTETTRDWLVLLGINGNISDNWKFNVYGNPVVQKYKYHAATYRDDYYKSYTEGRVDVSYLLMVGVSYKFKWGEEPRKLQRSTDFESDGKGGLM